jgi:predicted dehydrogenase/acetyltransferase-like isoleucine patch superfamily enzyme
VRTFAQIGALAAVADADSTRAADFAAQHGVPAMTVAEVLADESAQGVVIAAPAAEHATLALAALDAGKDVFVEKPLALTVEAAEEVVARARALDRVLMVGHLLQYHPAFLELRRMVDDGSLGQMRYLYSHRLNLGRFRREENTLWSFAPHDLSMLLALVGEQPDHVSAEGATYLTHHVPDVTTTHLRFPSGPRAHVFVSWLHPFKEQRLVVVGSEAMAVFDDLLPWSEKLRVYEHGVRWSHGDPTPVKADPSSVPLVEAEPLLVECQHFLDCMEHRATPRTDGIEALAVLRVLALAQEDLAVEPSGSVEPKIDRHPGAQLHASAVVDDDVALGAGTKVWHFSHILSGSKVGADCTIGQNVVIGPDVTVGDRCRIQNNVSVYTGVTLEDGVFCGPSCVFTNVYNPRAEVSRKDEFRPTTVRRGATIGANSTIVCGNDIGQFAFVGAGAVVIDHVPPHALVVGNPARQVGWMSHDGERLGDDLVCPRSGRRYEVVDGSLRSLDGTVG